VHPAFYQREVGVSFINTVRLEKTMGTGTVSIGMPDIFKFFDKHSKPEKK
jgi:hypothetical protein